MSKRQLSIQNNTSFIRGHRAQHVGLALSLAFVISCGNSTTEDRKDFSEPLPDCTTDNCGQRSFRAAIPTQKSTRIQFRTSAAALKPKSGAELPGDGNQALAPVSPVYLALGEYTDEINQVVGAVFADLEELAGTTPEVEEESRHVWRSPDPDELGYDRVLSVQSIDSDNYALVYSLGITGFSPSDGDTVMSGTVSTKDDEKTDFSLVIDFDNVASILPGVTATGTLSIEAHPFAGGVREIFYDFDGFSVGDEEPESSITTYWIFGEGSGALEYLTTVQEAEMTIYARWDGQGGRYDHHVEYPSEQFGLVDDIETNCWAALGKEVFTGQALIDQALAFYGELDGEESDCSFGPVEDHPNPGDEFENLPGDDEWNGIEFAADECEGDCEEPLCFDEPQAPNCIPFCDDEPGDPDCVNYCDVIDDPEVCP